MVYYEYLNRRSGRCWTHPRRDTGKGEFPMYPDLTTDEIERFWSKVDRSAGPNACWIWRAAVASNSAAGGDGYGCIWLRRRSIKAHRLAWFLTFGPIPEGLEVCHNCPDGDNPRCCNPAHLFLGTHQENVRDCIRKGRQPISTGTRNGRAKLTPELVALIRGRYRDGKGSHASLAREFGVHKTTIGRVVTGVRWKEVA